MQPPDSHQHRPASKVEQKLLDGLAGYLKESTIYPETNQRVQKSLSSVIDAAAKLIRGSEGIQIVIVGNSFLVRGGLVEKDAHAHSWLRNRLVKTALGGISLLPTLTDASMRDFAKGLAKAYARRKEPITFAQFWPDEYAGIRLIELRFLGSFEGDGLPHTGLAGGPDAFGRLKQLIDTGSVRDRALAELLESSEEILERLDRIEGSMASAGIDESRTRSLNLLGSIVHSLPTEALNDSEQAVRFVTMTLDQLDKELHSSTDHQFSEIDTRLQQLLRVASYTFFSSPPPEKTGERSGAADEPHESAKPESGQKSWRPEDDAIKESVPTLLEELGELPDYKKFRLVPEDLVVPSECLGIHLHQLTATREEELAQREYPFISNCLSDLDQEQLEVLGRYLERYVHANPDDVEGLDRIVELLETCDLLPLFAKTGAMCHNDVSFLFPRHFLLYLDTLTTEKECQELQRIASDIGPQRILAAGKELGTNGGIHRPDRVEKLFFVTHRVMLPFVRLVLEHGQQEVRTRCAVFLRKLKLRAKEASPLWVLEPPDSLPFEYLCQICDSEVVGRYSRKVTEHAAKLIRDFISREGQGSATLQRQVYAVNRLAAFPSITTVKFLEGLIKGKGLLGLPGAPRQLRDAAKNALRNMK